MGPNTSISPSGTMDASDTAGNNQPNTTGTDTASSVQQTPPASQPQAAQPSQPGQQPTGPGQQPAPGTSPQAAGAQGPPKPPNKPPQQGSGAAPQSAEPQNPSIQRAGRVKQVAETLMGGPRFKPVVDVNTGQTKYQPVPLSRADIGLAIAMEAISGSLAGLSQRGPGATGRAAEAGYQQVSQEQQDANKQQQEQASQDYVRHAQVLETNMRLYQNAQTVGRLNQESNQSYVSQFSPLVDMLMKDHPDVVKGVATYADLQKYHVTMDSAIPYKVVPRMDPKTGEQARDARGVPLSDIQYLIVDPSFKSGNLISPDNIATLQEMGKQGFVDGDGNPSKLPESLPLRLMTAMNLNSQAASYRLAKQDIQDYYAKLNESVEGGNVPMTMPTMHDQGTQAIADATADKYGVPRALVRAVANQESSGNSNAVSPKGAMGVMQLMPDTAKQMGVNDPFNVQQNIDGGVKYLKQLLDQYKGNTKLALAAYNAGPQNVTDHVPVNGETDKYVAAISKAIGLDDEEKPQAGVKDAYEIPDLAAKVKQDPSLVSALQQFQPLLNATQHNYERAIGELGAKDPQAAGKILELYGKTDLVHHFDQAQANEQLAAQKKAENDQLLSREAADRAAKNAENEAAYYDDAKAIAGDPNDPGSGDMMALDKLISQRTADRPKVYDLAKKINPNFNPANAELKLETWKGFADPTGKEYAQIKSANTLFDHIGDAMDSVNNLLHNTQYGEKVNKPINDFKKDWEGDPNLTQVIASIEPVKSEFMTFLNANHALTEHDKQAGDDIMNWDMSPQQLIGNLNQFAVTAALRLRESNEGFKRVFGTNAPGLLSSSDGVKTAMQKLPQVARILGDMDIGGTFLGSSTGRGTLGQTVNQALGLAPKYAYTTADGKMGWDGNNKKWVPIQQPQQPAGQ